MTSPTQQGSSDDAQVVTFLGRISAKKGVPLLVESFRIIAMAFPRAHLVIAGPDDEGIGRKLMPMVADVGLADRITFLESWAGARSGHSSSDPTYSCSHRLTRASGWPLPKRWPWAVRWW